MGEKNWHRISRYGQQKQTIQMSKTAICLIGFAIFVVVMLAFAIYEMKHAYEVNPNDETIFD